LKSSLNIASWITNAPAARPGPVAVSYTHLEEFEASSHQQNTILRRRRYTSISQALGRGIARIGVTSLSSDHLVSVLSTPRTTPRHNIRRKRSKPESYTSRTMEQSRIPSFKAMHADGPSFRRHTGDYDVSDPEHHRQYGFLVLIRYTIFMACSLRFLIRPRKGVHSPRLDIGPFRVPPTRSHSPSQSSGPWVNQNHSGKLGRVTSLSLDLFFCSFLRSICII